MSNRVNAETDEAQVAFADLPVYEAATAALIELDVLTATITELHERLTSHHLTADARQDIAADLLETTAALRAFAMVIAA